MSAPMLLIVLTFELRGKEIIMGVLKAVLTVLYERSELLSKNLVKMHNQILTSQYRL